MYDEEFDFVRYPDDYCVFICGIQWYLIPVYEYELDQLNQSFQPNRDYIKIEQWAMNDGYDVAVTERMYTWLCLKYGYPCMDSYYGDILKNDASTLIGELIETSYNYPVK